MAGARYIGAMNQFRHRGVTRISRLPPLAATRCARACGSVNGPARSIHGTGSKCERTGSKYSYKVQLWYGYMWYGFTRQ